MRRGSVLINEEDAATALLKQLLEKHPEATDDELWELFRPAYEDDVEISRRDRKLSPQDLALKALRV